jgi:hypothetical protein
MVMGADGKEVRACEKGSATLVMGADGNMVRACVKGSGSRRWVTGSETGALPVKGEHIQVQWTNDDEYKGEWFGAVVLMQDVTRPDAKDQKRHEHTVNYRKHLIQYTGDDQEEEWVLLEWSERPVSSKQKPSQSARAQGRALWHLNTVPWKRAEAAIAVMEEVVRQPGEQGGPHLY